MNKTTIVKVVALAAIALGTMQAGADAAHFARDPGVQDDPDRHRTVPADDRNGPEDE